MKTIETREDVRVLVNTFYVKIRQDDLLGPIFNAHIAKEKWPVHLSKLTDFWETNLFATASFKGNPTQKHQKVDQQLGHTVSPAHFEQWLSLWSKTVDELFVGERADKAKMAAQRMATGQFLAIWKNRPINQQGEAGKPSITNGPYSFN